MATVDKSPMGKNKTVLIVVGIVIVVALFLMAMKNKQMTAPNTVTNPEGSTFSLMDALKGGNSVKCSYDSGQGMATIYANGNRVRMDGFAYQGAGNSSGGWSMINDGQNIYMWNEQDGKGMKMSMTAITPPQGNTTEDALSNWGDMQKWSADLQNKYKVDCSSENVSESMFTPPTTVQFQDLSAMQEQMQKMQNSATQGQGFDPEQLKQLQNQYAPQ